MSRLVLHAGEADVDVLAAGGLVTVDGEGVFAGFEGGFGGGEDFGGVVVGGEAGLPAEGGGQSES